MTHVLAVRLDNDGDVLLAGPAIRALAHGAEHVTLLHGPRGRRAAALLPGVDGGSSGARRGSTPSRSRSIRPTSTPSPPRSRPCGPTAP